MLVWWAGGVSRQRRRRRAVSPAARFSLRGLFSPDAFFPFSPRRRSVHQPSAGRAYPHPPASNYPSLRFPRHAINLRTLPTEAYGNTSTRTDLIIITNGISLFTLPSSVSTHVARPAHHPPAAVERGVRRARSHHWPLGPRREFTCLNYQRRHAPSARSRCQLPRAHRPATTPHKPALRPRDPWRRWHT